MPPRIDHSILSRATWYEVRSSLRVVAVARVERRRVVDAVAQVADHDHVAGALERMVALTPALGGSARTTKPRKTIPAAS
jgi:hypothetical protein